MANKKGQCFLVGAGPGDTGLVTLRAKECIAQADLIVYDYLCNPEMLQWALLTEHRSAPGGVREGAGTLRRHRARQTQQRRLG